MKRPFRDKPRGEGKRKRKPVMFIALEGKNKTEKLYLRALNKDFGDKYSLQFTPGGETDPRNMWHSLQNLMSGSFSMEDEDKAYCVCDSDFESYKQEKLNDLKRNSLQDSAQFIISNPCFEIWLLNHFRYSTRQYSTFQELKSDLCKHIEGYEKNSDYYHSHLRTKTKEAVLNSNKQIYEVNRDKHSEDKVPKNPGTEMAKLVENFLD